VYKRIFHWNKTFPFFQFQQVCELLQTAGANFENQGASQTAKGMALGQICCTICAAALRAEQSCKNAKKMEKL